MSTKHTVLMNGHRKISLTPYYVISLSNSKYKRTSDQFMGKVRGNYNQTKFTLFDNGNNPMKTSHHVRNEYLATMSHEIDAIRFTKFRTITL